MARRTGDEHDSGGETGGCDVQLSALRMIRFDVATERRFRADLTARVIPLGRLGAALGIVLFGGLAFWDQHIDVGSLDRTMPIRLGVAGVFFLA